MATPEAPLRELLKNISFTQFPLHTTASFFAPSEIPRSQLHVHRPLRQSPGSSPTCDARSLHALALLRFASFDVDIVYGSAPDASPDGALPFLLMPSRAALDAKAIAQHVAAKLSNEPADHQAYLILAQHNLLPAIDYLFWVDRKGSSAVASRLLPFHPLIQRILGYQKARQVGDHLRVGQAELVGGTLDAAVLFENALRALDALVGLLAENEYFAGGQPGRLDALVFACVNCIVEIPVPSPLRSAVLREGSEYAPLVSFAMRILERYFPSQGDNLI
ncbi:hypothetical protein LPJ53_001645 [Coemansia erecta]|uniref:Metaxin glutathione S-transferase domain-containing protein n=1 Tax=Coemansia erecta TaxID=147472 RepID=A0A9W7Y314_9FUNG|nr:hypothetical protein LPJ53_001645 [Coemansia erecta]